MNENPYRRRERFLKELREELGWEAAILIRVENEGATSMCSTAERLPPKVVKLLPVLGEAITVLLEEAYQLLGATAVDWVDRQELP